MGRTDYLGEARLSSVEAPIPTLGTFRSPLSFFERLLQSFLLNVRPAPLASFLKRCLSVQRITIETPYGRFWVDPISNLGAALSRDGVYESGMSQTLQRHMPVGGTFVDLGANEGYFSVVIGRHAGPLSRILSIEPQNRLIPVIEKNLQLNGIDCAVILNAAITDDATQVTIHLAADTNTGASGSHKMAKYSLPSQTAEGMTLAQALDKAGLATVDLMKVDIEGGEYEALMGSQEVFRDRRVRAIALELHPSILASRGLSADTIESMLSSFGYQRETSFNNSVWILG